jgi:hypothetical protein
LRKGFTVAESLDLTSSFILFSWYLLIFVSFTIGQRIGTPRHATEHRRIPSLDSTGLYYTFTLLGATGVASTFFVIFHKLTFQQAVFYIALGQANQLKMSLYDNYSVGILSLRYLVMYSASLAIYRSIRFRKLTLINILNVVLLAMTALVSSRLILIATVLTSVFLLNHGKKSIKISPLKIGALACVLFLILSVLNYSRNSNFYGSRNLSFTEASLSEIITYLGSPFQVAIGAAKRTDDIAGEQAESYRDFVDVEIVLNTNSAFVQLHEEMGYYCWLYIAAICCFLGLIFSRLVSFGRTIFLLPCCAILYGSAELWRIDLFQQGIFIVWFLMGIGVPAVFLLFSERRQVLKSSHRVHPGIA